MEPIKTLWQAAVHLFQQARTLPQRMEAAGEERKQQVLRDEHEAERRDRICNPSKYLGK